MSADTPGPWSVGNTNDQADHINVWMGIVHVAAVMKFVATGESAEANARLIAAAPEMLEALQMQEQAEKWIAENDQSSPFFEATYSLMLEDARTSRQAAIAKATD